MHRMTLHAQRHRLDQRRAATLAGLLDRPLRLPVHGEHVGSVDDDAVEAVGSGAIGEMLDGVLEVARGGVRPLVVVDHEDDRQPADAGEVHALVRVATGRRSLAAPGDRDALLLADAKREGHAHGNGQHRGQVADHGVQPHARVGEVDVAVAPSGRPVGAAHVLREHTPRLDATRDVDSHVALQRCADVGGAHRGGDADRRRLVAASRVERAGDLALLVEDVAALLDPARDQHVAIDAEEILADEAGLLHLLERADGLRFPDCQIRLPGRRVGCTVSAQPAGARTGAGML